MLPIKIARILCFFDLFGFNSGASILFNYRCLSGFVKLMHILILVLLTSSSFLHFNDFYPIYGIVPTLNQFLEYSSTLCSYWLIIFDSHLHQRAHKQFWNKFQLCNHQQFGNKLYFNLQNYTIKGIDFFAITTLVGIAMVLSYNVAYDMIIAYIILNQSYQIRMFYHFFCIEAVHFQQ